MSPNFSGDGVEEAKMVEADATTTTEREDQYMIERKRHLPYAYHSPKPYITSHSYNIN